MRPFFDQLLVERDRRAKLVYPFFRCFRKPSSPKFFHMVTFFWLFTMLYTFVGNPYKEINPTAA